MELRIHMSYRMSVSILAFFQSENFWEKLIFFSEFHFWKFFMLLQCKTWYWTAITLFNGAARAYFSSNLNIKIESEYSVGIQNLWYSWGFLWRSLNSLGCIVQLICISSWAAATGLCQSIYFCKTPCRIIKTNTAYGKSLEKLLIYSWYCKVVSLT